MALVFRNQPFDSIEEVLVDVYSTIQYKIGGTAHMWRIECLMVIYDEIVSDWKQHFDPLAYTIWLRQKEEAIQLGQEFMVWLLAYPEYLDDVTPRKQSLLTQMVESIRLLLLC